MQRPSQKLAERKIGPYSISKVVNEVAYTVELPANMKIHPTFHVSLLSAYEEPNKHFAGRKAKKALPLQITPDGEEYEVEEVLAERKRRGKAEYLVKWKDYDSSHNSWEPKVNLNNEALASFKKKSNTRTTLPSKGRLTD